MLVTPSFVFLHLHKSGGTFVNTCLLRFVPGARQIGYHLPRHLIPPQHSNLPVLGLVRNPWSYYVSWYAFQSQRPQPNALYRILSDEGHLGFSGTVRNMLALGHDDALLDRVLAALPGAYANHGLNLPNFALAGIRGSGRGFYSFLHDHMYGTDAPALVHGRMELLRTDLPRMLAATGYDPGAELLAFIEHAAPINASAHEDYRTCYDDATAQLVAAADHSLLARYGYEFET